MFALLNRGWRLIFTGLSFSLFGIGSLVLGGIIFSIIHVIYPKLKAERLCRYGVCLAFRAFIGFMHYTGVLRFELTNEKTLPEPGQLIIANHPSLIDVIFIIAQVPDAFCVVKESAWRNPFMKFIMLTTGYIQNSSPESFIDDCATVLKRGDTLVMFPEGTRTKPNKPLKFRKGAARIALAAGKSITPVHIYLDPTTLTKGEPWFHLPKNRICFYMCVGDLIEPQSVVSLEDDHQKQVKTLTQYFVNYFGAINNEFINANTFSRN